ncbi:hypothetical protein SEA_BIG4_297 [Microbacterium phage Big4]|nr:hypothetical protein SEA_BIG4_297 [Microbacterium phage Big4]
MAVAVKLDPLPYVGYADIPAGGIPVRSKTPGDGLEFEPRDGFIQDEEMYP